MARPTRVARRAACFAALFTAVTTSAIAQTQLPDPVTASQGRASFANFTQRAAFGDWNYPPGDAAFFREGLIYDVGQRSHIAVPEASVTGTVRSMVEHALALPCASCAKGMAIDPKGKRHLEASQARDDLSNLTPTNANALNDFPVSASAPSVALDPHRRNLFVSIRDARRVTLLGLDGKAAANVDAGRLPESATHNAKGTLSAMDHSTPEVT